MQNFALQLLKHQSSFSSLIFSSAAISKHFYLCLSFQGQLSQVLNVLSDRATEAKEFLVQLRNMVQHIQVHSFIEFKTPQ